MNNAIMRDKRRGSAWSTFLIALLGLSLAACSSADDWDEQEVVESDRLLAEDVTAEWSLAATSGEGTLIRLQLANRDGEPIEQFDLNHEKLLHLIIVSKDLSYFNHVHPEYVGGGRFEIANEFPAGGDYRLIADFKPTGASGMTKLAWVSAAGKPAEPARVVASEQLADAASGVKAELSIDPLASKRDLTLTFTLADEATGEPIADLQPYLGAIGHVVVLSEDGEKYLHVHAEEGQGNGPVARFDTAFPKPGMYKIWGQFQRNGEVFTVAYVVEVP